MRLSRTLCPASRVGAAHRGDRPWPAGDDDVDGSQLWATNG